jgi:hypothetical protein
LRKIALVMAILGATVLLPLCAAPAYAQSVLTFVSHSGNDANICSATSPCGSFGGALAKTSAGGEIHCLDSGYFGGVGTSRITSSITIDCSGTNATALDVLTAYGMDIDAPGGVVVLRGISFSTDGRDGGLIGINITAATTVHIEDCVVTGFNKGIADLRTTGFTQLFVENTIVRNNHVNPNSPGIVLAAAPKNSVVLENVRSVSNGYGIAVATGNNVVISRSVISGNGIAGIEADPGAQVIVDNTEITHNAGYGIYALGTVSLANSDISYNTSSISGSTMSYGNNRLLGNGGGTAPTPAGGASTDFGQQ